MDLQRKAYGSLLEWKRRSNGRTALLITGARRVGKSHLAESFAKNEYRSYILIDFSKVSRDVLDSFRSDQMNLDLFFTKLSLVYQTRLFRRESLIVFDEVQLFPLARQFIKHLVADGRYDYIETGSLLSIRYNTEDILIPSEEEEMPLHPLDFEEFLWAVGDHSTIGLLRTLLDDLKPLGQAAHRSTLGLLRAYMLVGGMPQAVVEYAESGDFESVDRVKRAILKLYRNDITKFARQHKGKVMAVFDELPTQLAKKEKRFTLAALTSKARFREYESAFVWLTDAMIVNACFNSADPGPGLRINSERTTLKCYMADTGLLVSHALSGKDFTSNEVYRSILLGKTGINEGMFAENAVAQMLAANGRELFFYSRFDKADSAATMEIDFLLARGRKVVPLEVKSSAYRGHRSLDKFKERFGNKVGQRYVLHMKDLRVDGDVRYLPLYMTPFL
jgi:predicted AAA+ superfamily ATPase